MFKKKLLILSIVSFIMLISLVTASVMYTNKLNANNHFFLTEVEPRSKSLNAILTSFGYGHAIHNFKNLVIRGESGPSRDKYIEQLKYNKQQFYFALYNYVALVNQNTLAQFELSPGALQLLNAERASLKKIKIVFDRYLNQSTKVAAVYQKFNSNQGTNQDTKPSKQIPKPPAHIIEKIDAKVAIDDKPALNSMRVLQAGISQLRAEVLDNSRQLVTTLNMLIIMASVVLAAFICTAIMFGFQLLRPIVNLCKLIQTTGSTSAAVNQFSYPHNDEISQLFKHIKDYGPCAEEAPKTLEKKV